jgi:hypothetical protein
MILAFLDRIKGGAALEKNYATGHRKKKCIVCQELHVKGLR